MTIETLLVLFAIASVVALLVRLLSGVHLTGYLVSLVLACLGAVGGWWVQHQYLVPDALLTIPWGGRQVPVSVIGASVGALLLALLGRGWGQPLRQPSRRRRRYR
jgi:hypothetical protein